jgi:hypothetical protein
MRNEPDTPNLEPTQSKPSPDHRCTNLSGALNGVAIDEPHPCRDSRRYLIILIIGSHVAGPIASELGMVFPTAGGFHDSTDPRHERYRNDEFDGIDVFPFASTELSLLAVAPRLVELAERLMGERNLRIYSAEAWAKYTGATNYEDLHRDYLNHTVLVPTTAQRHQQLEMFVFLSEVPEELGPRSRSDTRPTYRQIPTSIPATAGMEHSWPPTIMLTCTTWSSQKPDRLAPSSRSTSAPFIGEPQSPSPALHDAVIACFP